MPSQGLPAGLLSDLQQQDSSKTAGALAALLRLSAGGAVDCRPAAAAAAAVLQGEAAAAVHKQLALRFLLSLPSLPPPVAMAVSSDVVTEAASPAAAAAARTAALRALGALPLAALRAFAAQLAPTLDDALAAEDAAVREAAIGAAAALLLQRRDVAAAATGGAASTCELAHGALLPVGHGGGGGGGGAGRALVDPVLLGERLAAACLDGDDGVAHAAAAGMRTLLLVVQGRKLLWDEDRSMDMFVHYRMVLRAARDAAVERLHGKVDALVGRMAAAHVNLRWPFVHLIRSLVRPPPDVDADVFGPLDKVPGGNADPVAASLERATDADVRRVIDSALLPQMGLLHAGLTFECATAVLDLTLGGGDAASVAAAAAAADEAGRSAAAPWVLAAARALVALLDARENETMRDVILDHAVRTLRFIAPVERMEVIIGLLRHVVFVRDSMDRKRALLLIAESVLALSLRTLSRHAAVLAAWSEPTRPPACPSTEFRLLMNVDYMRALWNGTPDPAMRADLCGAFCAAMLEIVPGDQGPEASLAGRVTPWVAVAMLVVETCSACLAWSFDAEAMSFHVDAFLRLFANLAHRFRESDAGVAESMAARLQYFFSRILSNFAHIRSDRLKTRVLWLLSEHLLVEDEATTEMREQLIDLLRRRLLDVDAKEARAAALEQAAQRGQLGEKGASGAAASTVELREVILRCVVRIGIRSSASLPDVINLLDDVQHDASVGIVLQDSARQAKQRVQYSHKIRVAQMDTVNRDVVAHRMDADFPPPWEIFDVSSPGFCENRDFEMACAQICLAGPAWRPMAVTARLEAAARPSCTPPVTVTAPCDPVHIHVSHVCNARTRSLAFHVRVHNVSDADLKAVRVRLAVVGQMDFEDGAMEAVRTVATLRARDMVNWHVSLGVLAFHNNAVHVTLSHDQRAISGRTASARALVHCAPYELHVNDLLCPLAMTRQQFMRVWGGLPATFIASCELWPGVPFGELEAAFASKPFGTVFFRAADDDTVCQLAYGAETWFGDLVYITATGSFDHGRNRWVCRFEVRSSSPTVLATLTEHFPPWFASLTDNLVETVVPTLSGARGADVFSLVDEDLPAEPCLVGDEQTAVFNRWRELRASIGLDASGPGAVNPLVGPLLPFGADAEAERKKKQQGGFHSPMLASVSARAAGAGAAISGAAGNAAAAVTGAAGGAVASAQAAAGDAKAAAEAKKAEMEAKAKDLQAKAKMAQKFA